MARRQSGRERSWLHGRRSLAHADTEHRRVKAFYSDHFVLPLPPEHSFPMAKYRLLRERLGADAILLPDGIVEAPAADWDTLRLVHTRGYADAVRTGTLSRDAQRRIGFPWSPEMVERSRRSVGATIAAARYALSHRSGTAANLAGGTHHAFADRGEGFCVFNDVAVATRVLTREGLVQRVAVIDCDVHQGNGTASIFRDDPSVFTFSTHGRNNYPFRKETSDFDLEWPDGTGDGEYLSALEAHVPDVLARHRPDLVFYLAGADPYEHDRWGRLKLTIDGLRRRDAVVFDACRIGGLPVVVTMAGGYARDVEAIVTIHANTIRIAATSAVIRARSRAAHP
jgi:acetoin utilization deacetylase AcuC-like enzyme